MREARCYRHHLGSHALCRWMGETAAEDSKEVFGNDLKIMTANDFRSKATRFAVHGVVKILNLR